MRTMKTSSLLLLALSSLVSLISVSSSKAQENFNTSDNYYYNNFDGGALGAKVTGSSASLAVSSTSPLSGSHSLASTGVGTAGGLQFSFLNSGTNLNNTDWGYEWTLVYRNNGSNTDDSKIIDNGENAWKYWLFSDNTNVSDMKGYYLTQNGSTMELRVRKSSNDDRSLISYNLNSLSGNNTTYAIRVQRIKRGSQYVWQLFIDTYSSLKTEASTPRGGLNYEADIYNIYNYSGLVVSSTSANRFKFDEIKTYSMKLLITGANAAANGISSPLYAGQQNAVIYGLNFQTRGFFDVYQFKVNLTGSITSILNVNSLKLNKSTDGYFGNADDSFLVNVPSNDVWDGAIQYYGSSNNPFASFWSVGAVDGSLATGGYLFITANVLANPNLNNNFAVNGTPIITGASGNQNYVSTPGTVEEIGSPPSASGNVYDWVGGTNSWSTASNWRYPNNTTPSTAPGQNDLVRIGVNKTFTNKPLVTANTTIGNLVIAGAYGSSPSIEINGTSTLTVSGSFTNQTASAILGSGSLALQGNWTTSAGKIDLTTGNATIKFTGAKSQAIADQGSDAGNGVVFGNVEFSGGGTKTLDGSGKFAVAIGKFLTMGTSTILDAAGKLTLKAGAAGAAAVDVIPSTSAIRGQLTVEKYIQGGSKNTWRTNRFLSSPVYDNTTNFVNADVDGNRKYSFTQFIDDMIITGAGGAANGFDVNSKNDASAWTYVTTLTAIPNINTSLNVGRGAYIYYRGDRTNPTGKLNAPYVDAESIVMTFKGGLNQQSITVPLVGNNIVGNPYAAVIDWKKVTKSANVSSVIKIWNPKNRQFSVYNGEYGVNDGSQFIGPGQGFTVQFTSGTTGSITFNESSKVAKTATVPAYNELMYVKETNRIATMASSNVGNSTVVEETPAKVRVLLTRDNTENSDETLLVMKRDELSTVAGYDVPRSGGEEVFLSSLSSDGRKMAINYMPHASEISSVKLGVDVNNNGTYTMALTANDIPVGFEAKLNDKYLNSVTAITDQGVNYQFSVDKAISGTFGSDRFEILVTPVTTLPVVWSDFSGNKLASGVMLNWKTTSETDNDYFEVFRAGDEQIYTSIGTVPSNQTGVYSLLDKAPLNGNNYYRLTQVDKDGKPSDFPKLVVIKYDLNAAAADIVVYPTLVQSTFRVKYNASANATSYLLRVSDVTGKEVYKRVVDKNDLINGFEGDLSVANKGVYFVTVFDGLNGNKVGMVKIIKK